MSETLDSKQKNWRERPQEGQQMGGRCCRREMSCEITTIWTNVTIPRLFPLLLSDTGNDRHEYTPEDRETRPKQAQKIHISASLYLTVHVIQCRNESSGLKMKQKLFFTFSLLRKHVHRTKTTSSDSASKEFKAQASNPNPDREHFKSSVCRSSSHKRWISSSSSSSLHVPASRLWSRLDTFIFYFKLFLKK